MSVTRAWPAALAAALAALAPLLGAAAELPGGYDLLVTDLALVIDVDDRAIRGRQTTTLRAETALRELQFDASALEIATASLDGAPLRWRLEGSTLVLVLPRTLRAGERSTLRFDYAGQPARGLVFEDGLVYTSYFACDWMLCALDRPADRFELNVALEAPEGWRTFAAERARPYPAYLQGFAAGRLTEARDRIAGTDLVYASAHASAEDLVALFRETPRMLAFFEEAAGVAFPHATYTQLLVRGAAAQEAAGFAVLGDDVVRPVLADPTDDWAAAHELAHQYWGNLVTCVDWSEFWLNEGLTTFMVAAWKERRWGAAAYAREIERAEARWQGARDAGWDRPLAFSGAYPDLRTRRAVQYSKGMLFFVELRRELGDAAFWRGIRLYTREHAGGTVESADLERAMERASGRQLSPLFGEWVYE